MSPAVRRWTPVLALVGLLAGLGLTLRLAAAAIHASEGYEAGVTDCDDCGLTILLDHVGWLALAVVVYLAGALLAWRLIRRARGRAD